jgi:hypothetical protein
VRVVHTGFAPDDEPPDSVGASAIYHELLIDTGAQRLYTPSKVAPPVDR